VPKLADQGVYLASESSFYRMSRVRRGSSITAAGQGRPSSESRRPVTGHRARARSGPGSEARPGLAGIKLSGGQFEAPNTWMPGPIAGLFFYLYLIVDIGRRKIVGWEVHEREAAELAATLIQKAVWAEDCISRPLVLHADPNSKTAAAQ